MINLAVCKLFLYDRNSFPYEAGKKLKLYSATTHTLNEEGLVIIQNNEEVKTDSSYFTSINTPEMLSDEMQNK